MIKGYRTVNMSNLFSFHVSVNWGIIQDEFPRWSADVLLHILYDAHYCVHICMCAAALLRARSAVDHFWCACGQLPSRCALRSHVWIPFVVSVSGRHQDQTHPQTLTAGAADLAAQLLINQSDERTRLHRAMAAWTEERTVRRLSPVSLLWCRSRPPQWRCCFVVSRQMRLCLPPDCRRDFRSSSAFRLTGNLRCYQMIWTVLGVFKTRSFVVRLAPPPAIVTQYTLHR